MGNSPSNQHGRGDRTTEREHWAAIRKCFDTFSIFVGHTDIVRCIAAVDASTVVTGADDGYIIVWDLVRRIPRLKISGVDGDEPARKQAIRGLLTLPELNIVASCITRDPTITLWSLVSGQRLAVLRGQHRGAVHCLAPVPGNNHLLATAGDDDIICLWTAAPAANGFSAGFKTIDEVGSDGTGKYCPLSMPDTWCMGWARRDDCNGQWSRKDVTLLVALDSSRVVAVSSSSSVLHVYCLTPPGLQNDKMKVVQVLNTGHDACAIITQLIGIASLSLIASGDDKGRVVMWNTTSLAPVRVTNLPKLLRQKTVKEKEEYPIRAMVPDVRHHTLAVGAGSNLALLPMPEAGEMKCKYDVEPYSRGLRVHELPITQIAWLPASDSQFLITTSEDTTIKVWDTFSKEHRKVALRDAQVSSNLALSEGRSRSNSASCSPHNSTTTSLNTLPSSRPNSMWRSLFQPKKKGPPTESDGCITHRSDGDVSHTPQLPLLTTRPFRQVLDPTDTVCHLHAHSEKVTGIATLPGTGMGFVSCGCDTQVVYWMVGAYFDTRLLEAARLSRMQALHDLPPRDSGVKNPNYATGWWRSIDPECSWLSRGAEHEMHLKMAQAGISANPTAFDDQSRIPNTSPLLEASTMGLLSPSTLPAASPLGLDVLGNSSSSAATLSNPISPAEGLARCVRFLPTSPLPTRRSNLGDTSVSAPAHHIASFFRTSDISTDSFPHRSFSTDDLGAAKLHKPHPKRTYSDFALWGARRTAIHRQSGAAITPPLPHKSTLSPPVTAPHAHTATSPCFLPEPSDPDSSYRDRLPTDEDDIMSPLSDLDGGGSFL